MAAPVLKHVRVQTSATANTIVYTAAVPAGRAWVISKLAFGWASSAVGTFTLYYGSTGDGTTILNGQTPLSQGQVWTETGIVLEAGEKIGISVNVSNAGGVGMLHLFLEEVDN